MNVGAVLEFRKLDFKGLKGQLDLKRASFRRLIPKFGHFWPILATRTHLWQIFMGYAMNCALRYVGGFLVLRKLNFGGLKGQFDVKKPSLED